MNKEILQESKEETTLDRFIKIGFIWVGLMIALLLSVVWQGKTFIVLSDALKATGMLLASSIFLFYGFRLFRRL